MLKAKQNKNCLFNKQTNNQKEQTGITYKSNMDRISDKISKKCVSLLFVAFHGKDGDEQGQRTSEIPTQHFPDGVRSRIALWPISFYRHMQLA